VSDPTEDPVIANQAKIAQLAVARDRCERASFLLGGIIEDLSAPPPEQFDNGERLRNAGSALYEALTRLVALDDRIPKVKT